MTTNVDSPTFVPRSQRWLWWTILGACVSVLTTAAAITPDPSGHGTHTQLGLPPCGFLLLTGYPCPGCGLTTAFAYGVRGPWLLAASANPLGLVLFLVVCLCIPLAAYAALRDWSLDVVIQRFALNRWGLALAGGATVMWVVRLCAAL